MCVIVYFENRRKLRTVEECCPKMLSGSCLKKTLLFQIHNISFSYDPVNFAAKEHKKFSKTQNPPKHHKCLKGQKIKIRKQKFPNLLVEVTELEHAASTS